MANMLRRHSPYWWGCCNACARGRRKKPGRQERRMARALEKRRTRKEIDAQR